MVDDFSTASEFRGKSTSPIAKSQHNPSRCKRPLVTQNTRTRPADFGSHPVRKRGLQRNGCLTILRCEFQRQGADVVYSLLDGRIPTPYLNLISLNSAGRTMRRADGNVCPTFKKLPQRVGANVRATISRMILRPNVTKPRFRSSCKRRLDIEKGPKRTIAASTLRVNYVHQIRLVTWRRPDVAIRSRAPLPLFHSAHVCGQ